MMESEIMNQLLATTVLQKVDQEEIQQDIEDMKSMYESYAEMYGMEYEDFIAQMGYDDAALTEELTEQAVSYETYQAALLKIAELEGIEDTDEVYQAFLEEAAGDYAFDSAEEFKEAIEAEGEEAVSGMRKQALIEKALEVIFKNAVHDPNGGFAGLYGGLSYDDEDEDDEVTVLDGEDEIILDEEDLLPEDEELLEIDMDEALEEVMEETDGEA
jgi:hypothetical protein